ncbi:hypothetical protein H109_01820 [Trichophyton interdigitale MR816]|uniref:Altered inheritance of mitochondria protein 9, mitochondrial n=1 Tax=Trichophyton interdigitale (strain MR816) TaxID=1215338 RepID=A0A059JFT9_TRIIM|nr:hypothetical protein H109_01820 [Trichophyton interdigitale MR816]
MQLPQKLQVLLAVTRMQKRWLGVSFSHYGSLYYASDLQTPAGSHYAKDGKVIMDSGFALGPATGREWADAGRASLDIDRGPWTSLTQYLRAVGDRKRAAIKLLKPPKQIALFCGPRLYQPNSETKLTALSHYQQIIDALAPSAGTIKSQYLWHDDLHDDNIFVDPSNPEEITGIIDWQSPKLSGLSPEERAAALHEYSYHNIFIGWRKLMQAKNPGLYEAVEFRKTASYGLIFLAHRMFEYGETHFESLLADLKDTWPELPAVSSNKPFPFDFSKEEFERIKISSDHAVASTDLVTEVKEQLGDLWPDKGFIEHDRFDECKICSRRG